MYPKITVLEVQKSLDQVIAQCAVAGVPAKASKIVPATQQATKILGIIVEAKGTLRPENGKMAGLLCKSLRYAQFRVWAPKVVEHLIGKWTWFLLLRRPLFSVLDQLYAFSRKPAPQAPSMRCRQELVTLCCLAPVMQGDLSRPWYNRVICTDASLQGGGVVYGPLRTGEEQEVLDAAETPPEWVQRRKWTVAFGHKWKDAAAIHLLEGEAVLLGLRWLLRQQGPRSCRILFLIDNMTLLGALNKGRSASSRLNQICRRAAGLILAGDLSIEFRYIRSELNPADAPSRQF